MKSIKLVLTMLLMTVSIAGFGNSTADLDENLKTDAIEYAQIDLQSVDAEVLSIGFTQVDLTSVASIKEVIKLKLIESHKLLEDLSSTTLKPDKRNKSWFNYHYKIKNYNYTFTHKLTKSNRIRILC